MGQLQEEINFSSHEKSGAVIYIRSMRQQPTDRDEETRARSLFEQYWLGPLCLVLWVFAIVAVFYGCSAKGAECVISWDDPPAEQNVTKWRVFVGLEVVEVTTPQATIILPDAPCTVAVVAVSNTGQSEPATLNLSYVTDQESVDMRAWATMRGYHREFLPGRRFYRTIIQTP